MFTAVFRAGEAMGEEGEEGEDETVEELGIPEVPEGGGEGEGEEVIQITSPKEEITSYSPNGALNNGCLTHYQSSPRPPPTQYFSPNNPRSLYIRTLHWCRGSLTHQNTLVLLQPSLYITSQASVHWVPPHFPYNRLLCHWIAHISHTPKSNTMSKILRYNHLRGTRNPQSPY